jgi:hypothetical protein
MKALKRSINPLIHKLGAGRRLVFSIMLPAALLPLTGCPILKDWVILCASDQFLALCKDPKSHSSDFF